MVLGRGDRPALHGSSTSSARADQGSAKTLTDENGEWPSATNFLALILADEDSDCDDLPGEGDRVATCGDDICEAMPSLLDDLPSRSIPEEIPYP